MNYTILPGLTKDGQVYFNQEMGTVEAILPPGPWPGLCCPAAAALSADGGIIYAAGIRKFVRCVSFTEADVMGHGETASVPATPFPEKTRDNHNKKPAHIL